MTFIEALDNLESRKLIDQIEELLGEEEQELVRIRKALIRELKSKFDYAFKA